MKRISQTSNWIRYKNSTEGKEVIDLFNHLTTHDASVEEMLELINRFNPKFRNTSIKEKKQFIKTLSYYDSIVKDDLPQSEEEWNNFDPVDYFLWLTQGLAVEEEEIDLMEASQSGFKTILESSIFLSVVLFAHISDYFFPNLYVMQFSYFLKFAEKYGIVIPDIPNRSDYRERWLYYLCMCDAINKFADENDLQDPGELCAFLFDYELTTIKEELETEQNEQLTGVPEQAWILVGSLSEGERTMTSGFWQANQLTCKGDIMLFYEKSPVKKLNAVWTALEDGFVDPFGHFYSYSIIGNKITIPEDKAITFEDFKASDYFKNRPKEGDYVSKNFQDVSGWAVTSEDYAEIKKMLEAKGFDISALPSLYEPNVKTDITITNEKNVEDCLLKPLLEQMGWRSEVDYFQQVEFPAGHGTTGHRMEKRPDFCLHKTGEGRKLGAKVVIEVKECMRSTKEIDETYEQGLTYAKWGGAQVLVLCDKNQIRVYKRNGKGEFDENKWTRFRWEEMQILEKYNELKRMLDI